MPTNFTLLSRNDKMPLSDELFVPSPSRDIEITRAVTKPVVTESAPGYYTQKYVVLIIETYFDTHVKQLITRACRGIVSQNYDPDTGQTIANPFNSVRFSLMRDTKKLETQHAPSYDSARLAQQARATADAINDKALIFWAEDLEPELTKG